MTTAFFGHGNAPSDLEPRIEQAVIQLMEENENIAFLAGTHGRFDAMARSVLKRLAPQYPNMKYRIVLAYMPVKKEDEVDRFEEIGRAHV